MSRETHVTWHAHQIGRADREQLAGHRGCVLWFTGLSGCGKSTVANAVEHVLYQRQIHSFLLDGDNLRHGLNASPAMLLADYGAAFADRFGLGFGALDRTENIRRLAAVAQLFVAAGLVTLTAFVSPYRRDRDAARRQITAQGQADDFVEIYCNAPMEVCEQRDPKGLYKKARAGELRQFTGIDDPYEAPLAAELTLDSARQTPGELAAQVINYLETSGKIPRIT
jgi:adenylylsulfate kinase